MPLNGKNSKHTFRVLLRGCVSSAVVHHSKRDLGDLNVLKKSVLVYSIVNIVVIRPGDQDVTSCLHGLSKLMCTRKWTINSMDS